MTRTLGDLDFWRPHVAAVLRRHGVGDAAHEAVAGFNPTWPTFVCGDVVVKLFGGFPAWREAHAAERAAHALVATDPSIAAPAVLAEGRLSDDADAPWPYLVTARMRGVPWRDARLTAEERLSVAADLGRQVRRVHALRPPRPLPSETWRPPDVAAAAARSSLPPHLGAQVEDYVARLGPFDAVFVHGDLVAMHAFVEEGRLAGIIDWGDATVADRHYEIVQVHRDTFDCDKTLLRAFLAASHWPVAEDFPRRALGLALCRQATGLARHRTMDVFEPVAAALPLGDIASLDELADALFAV